MRHLCSKPDGPPCLLVIDGVNFLWCRGTRLKDKTLHTKVTVDRLAIVHHLRRALKADWRHGACITSLNIRGAWPSDREKYTPGYLLGADGFKAMDPFIPVPVENYTPTELDACLRFYAENQWLTNPAAQTDHGRAQIAFLSANNPRELDRIVAECTSPVDSSRMNALRRLRDWLSATDVPLKPAFGGQASTVSEAYMTTHEPATGLPLVYFRQTTPKELDNIVSGAIQAQREWSCLAPLERSKVS
ncbi:unnamed protein product [Echinostoma caproni]|uniref:Small ribosomal subunit protein mS29 n=1 Tax=Echinostoma caproni TaxID=27848 RepID=A0A183B3G3_9TREM|nr:unnamed protein product [Echinostoma caproni]